MSSQARSLTKPILLLAAAIAVLAAAVIIWDFRKPSDVAESHVQADPFALLDLKDPKPSYLLLQYVAHAGGDKITRQMAIDWLSEQSRQRVRLEPEQEDWLFSMIEGGGHSDWEIGYTQWLFNDAFNVLHNARDQERLTHLLEGLALTHENKTMRLYALQHLELQRTGGRLVDDLAEQVHATLLTMAQDNNGELAGTALVNLIAWDGPETAPSQELMELALDIAADNQRADDIRVTALHAVGEHSLELSRMIATDTDQPIHVRKAAIAWMGKHGSDADTATLQQLSEENFRIAQAAKPALKAIESRKDGEAARTLIQL